MAPVGALMKALTVVAIVAVLLFVGAVLYKQGYLSGGDPAPSGPSGNSYRTGIASGSVTAAGGSPNIAVGEDSTSISGSQATMMSVTSISMKLFVMHLNGSGVRMFELT